MKTNAHRPMRGFRMRYGLSVLASVSATISSGVSAQQTEGTVVSVDGHVFPACRVIAIRAESNAISHFRIPDTGADNSILAVALTALTSGIKVRVSYSTSTTGCGTEPRVDYISIFR